MKTTKLQKIDEVENPQVGSYYLVPHVFDEIDKERYLQDVKAFDERTDSQIMIRPQATASVWEGREPLWLPVYGEKHEDSKWLDFPHYHFHYDWRFASAAMVRRYSHEPNPNSPDVFGDSNRFFGNVLHTKYMKDTTIVYKKRKMMRQQAIFPRFLTSRLEGYYIDKVLIEGHLCPHKGATLNGTACDTYGNRICPLHGLAFDADGRCVKRKTREEEMSYFKQLNNQK